jgi:drug/metabolite transporter (DMT)-like permease
MIVVILSAFTLTAFAANSLLCRMALGGDLIDPVSFTTLRLVSGALALAPISRVVAESKAPQKTKGSWGSGFALFTYAAAFSLAYVSLSTGMGALILFGSVQVTMISAALKSGEKLGSVQWVGSIVAISGLIYLVLPGISAPDPIGALLMGIAGIAWGVYSIRGKDVSAPVSMNRYVRARICPLVQSVEKPDDEPGIGGATLGASSCCLRRCRVPFRASVREAGLRERSDTWRGSHGSIEARSCAGTCCN